MQLSSRGFMLVFLDLQVNLQDESSLWFASTVRHRNRKQFPHEIHE